MDKDTWNDLIASLPSLHILQTWQWAQVKARFGWQPTPIAWHDRQGQVAAAAMVLTRNVQVGRLAVPMRVMYVSKGPLLRDWANVSLRRQVLNDLGSLARRQGAIFVKIDPDIRLGEGVPGDAESKGDHLGETIVSELREQGWRYSTEQVQFRNTVLVDLSPSEDQLLARMKQKTRYNVRLAGRRGVAVRVGTETDFGQLYRMYAETSVRDGFVIRDENYYREVWGTFYRAGMAEPLIAEVGGGPVAALVVFRFTSRAWYLYGMSHDVHREKMPNYLLQWEAMRRAKAAGCRVYDLWGAPDEFVEGDPLWGVYRFKEGLGGKVVRHIGAWDLPVRPVHYWLYIRLLPRLLGVLRRRGRARTSRMVKGVA